MSEQPRRPSMTPEEAESGVNVFLHPAAFDGFVDWLDKRGIDLSPPIPDGEGGTFRVLSPRLDRGTS